MVIGQFTQNRWGKLARKSYLSRIESAFDTLVVQPGLGSNRDEIRLGLKSFVVARHVIYFDVIVPNQVRFIRILHQAMDVPSRTDLDVGQPTAQ